MGRPLGARGKNKEFLMNRLQEMYGDDFDPIMKIAKNCTLQQRDADETISDVFEYYEKRKSEPKFDSDKLLALKTSNTEFIIETLKPINEQWERMAAYVHPKLKAVEVKLQSTDPYAGSTREELLLRLQLIDLERSSPGNSGGADESQGDADEGGAQNSS